MAENNFTYGVGCLVSRGMLQRVVRHGVYIWLLCEVLWLGIVPAADGPPPFSITDANWRSDFSRHTVPLSEIRSGGPPRDGIPPLDTPRFVPFATANPWLHDREPVIAVHRHGVAKAYPLQILLWHEIVNDTIGDEPIAVTFCPLCNSAIAFQRQLEAQGLDFGTTGRLRHSDLVMWDRVGATGVFLPQLDGHAVTLVAQGEAFTDIETQSTWNILGTAIAGPLALAGRQLPPVVHGDHFAFAWLVFKPQTQIYGP